MAICWNSENLWATLNGDAWSSSFISSSSEETIVPATKIVAHYQHGRYRHLDSVMSYKNVLTRGGIHLPREIIVLIARFSFGPEIMEALFSTRYTNDLYCSVRCCCFCGLRDQFQKSKQLSKKIEYRYLDICCSISCTLLTLQLWDEDNDRFSIYREQEKIFEVITMAFIYPQLLQ